MDLSGYAGWFEERILKRMSYLCSQREVNGRVTQILQVSRDTVLIEETRTEGKAELRVNVKKPSICFNQLENTPWLYMDYHSVSDGLIFQNIDGKFQLHIFELKKTVYSKSWQKAKMQWAGAFLYALMIAGLLGITVDRKDITLYLGYRYDKFKEERRARPLEPRAELSRLDKRAEGKGAGEWNRSTVALELFEPLECPFVKIILDESDGKGVLEL